MSKIEVFEKEIRTHLETLARHGQKQPSWKYSSFEAFVLENGFAMQGSKLPKTISQGEPKQCFDNAGRRAAFCKDLLVCEGWAINPKGLPVHHGWLTNLDLTEVYDPTWNYNPEECFYFGVAFSKPFQILMLETIKHWGFFYSGHSKGDELILKDGADIVRP